MRGSANRASNRRLIFKAALLAVGLGIGGPAVAARVPASGIVPATWPRADMSLVPPPLGENLGYEYTYSLGISWPQSGLQTPESIMSELARNFRYRFSLLSTCRTLPAVGERCDVYDGNAVSPVRVVRRTPTSFSLLTLPGNVEGAGRYTRFTIYRVGTDRGADLRLRVSGGGPWNVAAWSAIASGRTHRRWDQFAANIGRVYRRARR